MEKPLLIVKRSMPVKHYELHYNKKVDFITLDGKYLGSSKVEVIENSNLHR